MNKNKSRARANMWQVIYMIRKTSYAMAKKNGKCGELRQATSPISTLAPFGQLSRSARK